jgi:SNF2 family DNA or RNA helicase
LLGDLAGFNKEFAAASHDARGSGENPTQQILRELLRQRIAPFMLRRRKEDVLQDLPPKIEIDRLIPISDRQAEVYESYRLRLHRELSEAIEQRGVGKAQLSILEGLLRLRQICCDLRLLDEADKESATEDSAKLIALMELAAESLSENRPVLIFSQFVGMLRLIEKEVVRAGWSYSMLTGQTAQREEQIRRFQDGERNVFLISLKAGGLGLNLTRAETVIHYDPWWNPAAEAHATDRAHRIGQKKTVTMYRLVTEKTIEERILSLHAAKRELAESLVGSAGDSPVHRIDAEVLEQLLGVD